VACAHHEPPTGLPVIFCDRQRGHASQPPTQAGAVSRRVYWKRTAGKRWMPPPKDVLAWLGSRHRGPRPMKWETSCARLSSAHSAEAAKAFRARAKRRAKWWCDLYMLARQRLEAAGIAVPSTAGGSVTYTDQGAVSFSFRRDGGCGRMATLIWLAGTNSRPPGPTVFSSHSASTFSSSFFTSVC